MSDNPNAIQVPIVFTVDNRRADGNLQSISKLVKENLSTIDRIAKRGGLGAIALGQDRIKAAGLQVATLGNELLGAARQAEKLRTELEGVDSSSDDFARLQTEITGTEARIASLRTEIAKVPRDLRETTQDTIGFLGDIDTSLSTVSRASIISARTLQTFGGDGTRAISQPLDLAGRGIQASAEFFAVAEALPRLSAAMGTLRERLAQVNLATLTAHKGLITAGIALAGLAAIALAIDKAADSAKGSLKDYVDGLEDVNVALLDASQTALITSQAQLEQTKSTNEQQLATLRQQKEELERGIAGIDSALDDRFGVLSGVIQTVGFNADDLKDKLSEVNSELITAEKNFATLSTGLIDVSIAAKNAADATAAELNLSRQLVEITERGTTEDLDKLREDAELQRQAINDTIGIQTNALRDGLIEQLSIALGQTIEEVESNLVGTTPDQIRFLLNTLNALGVELVPGIVDLQGAIDGLREDAAFTTYVIEQTLNPAIIGRTEQTEREAKALEDAKKATEEAAQAEKDLQKARGEALTTLQDARQELADFDKQLSLENEKRAREADRNSQRQALRNQIDAAKAAEAETERTSRINEARQKADADAKQLDAKFKADTLKAEKDYGKERAKIIKDTNRAKADAELDNDVNAFIAAEQAGVDQLSELEQNFQDEQAERQRQHQESLNNLRTQLAEKERTELATRQQTATRSQQLERQLAALEESFKVEDAKRELALQQQASATRRQILITEVNEARNILRLLQSSAARAAALAGVRQGVNNAASAIGNALSGVLSFAEGGIATRPTLAIVGDKPGFAEAMIPFRPSEGISKAAGKAGLGGGNTYNLNLTVGEHVTQTDIRMLQDAIIQAEMMHYEAVS